MLKKVKKLYYYATFILIGRYYRNKTYKNCILFYYLHYLLREIKSKNRQVLYLKNKI